ncbi:MAG: hypothetical protein RBT47_02105 [Anaerolineae bacterium]|jgi:polyhydroxyalkanoate synthesis regulator phasin|nr:hypothetical protein [Anaerolineae bacterium]
MLKEQIERSILMGIGLFSITREKAQVYVEELVKQGGAARDEVKELTEKLVKRGEEERKALRTLIREEMDTALKEMHLSTTEDIKNLQAQIEALKAEVAAASSKKA